MVAQLDWCCCDGRSLPSVGCGHSWPVVVVVGGRHHCWRVGRGCRPSWHDGRRRGTPIWIIGVPHRPFGVVFVSIS